MTLTLEDIQNIIASDSRFKGVDAKKAYADYLDELASRNTEELPEVTVTAPSRSSIAESRKNE